VHERPRVLQHAAVAAPTVPAHTPPQLAASAANLNLTALGVDVNMCAVPAGSAVSGRYLQASSQFPGRGPCYPVWAATVPYFNRCVALWRGLVAGPVA
jgi:hypothetical protein